MKKTKLLTSFVALALVLSLGACNEAEDDTTLEDEESATTTETEGGDGETSGSGDGEGGTEEVFTTTSTDYSDALNLLSENGAAIDSWTGINGEMVYSFDPYYDLTQYGYEGQYYYVEDSSVAEAEILQATLKDGVLTGLDDFTYSDSDGDYRYAMFISGSDAYENDDGEIGYYPYYGLFYSLEDFTESLVDLIEDDDSGIVTQFELIDLFIQYGIYDNYEFTGELATSNLGNVKGNVTLTGVDSGYYYGYTYDETEIVSADFVYDAEGELVSFDYFYYLLDIWSDGEIDIEQETIHFEPFDGEVATPDWVLSYSAN